jgi:adenylate kinase family enzyme
MNAFERTLIIGNGGSGKTWLANQLGNRLVLPVHHLDEIHWEPGQSGVARDKTLVMQDVCAVAATTSWLIEGVYGWLAQAVIGRATTLIWIDLPVLECIENIEVRGRQNGESLEDFQALLAWVGEYHTRQSSSAYAAHQQLYLQHDGAKFRLDSRDAVSSLASGQA